MVKLVRAFFVVLLASLPTGCTLPVACYLFNNGNALVVIERSRTDGMVQTIDIPIGRSAKLDNWPFWTYRVRMNGNTMRLSPLVPDQSFIKVEGIGPWAERTFTGQLQPDGTVYVLGTQEVPPVAEFLPQPVDFPLRLDVE